MRITDQGFKPRCVQDNAPHTASTASARHDEQTCQLTMCQQLRRGGPCKQNRLAGSRGRATNTKRKPTTPTDSTMAGAVRRDPGVDVRIGLDIQSVVDLDDFLQSLRIDTAYACGAVRSTRKPKQPAALRFVDEAGCLMHLWHPGAICTLEAWTPWTYKQVWTSRSLRADSNPQTDHGQHGRRGLWEARRVSPSAL